MTRLNYARNIRCLTERYHVHPGPHLSHHCLCLQVLGGGTMKIRTNDAAYLTHVDRWWSELLPRMTRLLYSNGGPIVLIQVLHRAPAQMDRAPSASPEALCSCS